MEEHQPILQRRIEIPSGFLVEETVDLGGRDHTFTFGGDIRMGDLDGDGRVEFVTFRCAGGHKPCFIGAFDLDSMALWSFGEGGEQPLRPGAVAVYDIDGDGRDEVIAAFAPHDGGAAPDSCEDLRFVILEGATGTVRHEAVVKAISASGERFDPSSRILVADFQGHGRPASLLIRTGRLYTALAADFSVLWTYRIPEAWTAYGHAPAYVPSVGDIDGDGRDEVNGGYFLLDHNGSPLWEKDHAPHCDSVAIDRWSDGQMRAFCSGHGTVFDSRGEVAVSLGAEAVPHGQELRVAHFIKGLPGNQMIIRCNGHTPDVLVVTGEGRIAGEWFLNPTTNNTGMEAVYWDGPKNAALVCNGAALWRASGSLEHLLPGLPTPLGNKERLRMSWYHCIPANVCGDEREEVVIYNPWDSFVNIYTPAPYDESAFEGYRAGPRQYNVRIMN